jgi:hypothetical protein
MNFVDNLLDPNNTDSQLVVFGLTLPPAQEANLIYLNSILSETQQLRYQLNPETHKPYIRLYEAAFPNHNYQQVVTITQTICQESSPISFHWGEIELTHKVIMLCEQLDQELRAFQLKLVDKLNPLREGYLKHEYQHPGKYYTNPQKQSISTWGWPWLTEYEPYVIIAQPETSFNLNEVNISWDFKHCTSSHLLLSPKKDSGHLHQANLFTLGEESVISV